jgi:hypothetical protein
MFRLVPGAKWRKNAEFEGTKSGLNTGIGAPVLPDKPVNPPSKPYMACDPVILAILP